MLTRKAGVLSHVSSLPSRFLVGGLGKECKDFIDKIKDAGFSYWQVLPLSIPDDSNSPYSSSCFYAGNEYLIDPEALFEKGYLDLNDISSLEEKLSSKVNWNNVKKLKYPILIKAAKKFIFTLSKDKEESIKFHNFKTKEKYWLDNYAVFRFLKKKNDQKPWWQWEKKEADYNKDYISSLQDVYFDEINIYKVIQYFFYTQWMDTLSYANSKGVQIIGDLPFCSSYDSAEVWSARHLFEINNKNEVTSVIGVPPDYFSENGQLWGTPSYKWSSHKKEKYDFWIKKMGFALSIYNLVRLDHFRGFEATWCVPSGEKTAKNGEWVKSPGDEILTSVFNTYNLNKDNNPFIAEDLGILTEDVYKLRDKFNLPSIKVMEFGISENFDNPHLPHSWSENTVAYLGTHDNNTLVGWWNHDAELWQREKAKEYFYSNDESTPWYMIRSLFASNAKIVIMQVQDLLFQDSYHRMNTPSTLSDSNWSYRITESFDNKKFYNILNMFSRL